MSHQPWLATYKKIGLPDSTNAEAYPSVVAMLDEAMRRFADKPAFRSFGQTLSYADVDRLSGDFAAWLFTIAHRCAIDVHTAAQGFAPIWQAVLRDFGERHAAGGLKIEIHDVGATPAVVSLRLDQALEAWEEGNA